MGHVVVSHLGKAYRRYHTRWGRLLEWIDPDDRVFHEEHWVLRDVSFRVAPGEAVGIVGHNGAGKSTLLKLVTGTTKPTTGTIDIGGRVAALLELGMGFHPEFTGRQNALMAGQLLGIGTEALGQLIPGIIEFAEIGDYLDQPTRTYSSGMQMRLAFAVATCVRPDVLIVDEALSVGDAYFQAKCIERIREFRAQGTTLLFVSHSVGAVKAVCDRAILLDRGVVRRDGPADEVLDYYNAVIATRQANEAIRQAEERGVVTTRSGDRSATVERVELCDARNVSSRAVTVASPVVFRVEFMVRQPVAELTVGLLIRDALGSDVFGTNTFHHDCSMEQPDAPGTYVAEFRAPHLELGPGTYTVSVALHASDVHVARNHDWWDRALAFEVVPGARAFSIGPANMPLDVSIRRNDNGAPSLVDTRSS